jgi:hypothetical protein
VISGDRINLAYFQSGWVLFPEASVAHFVALRRGDHRPLCGVSVKHWSDGAGRVAFGPGDYPKCRRCEPRATLRAA